MCLLFLMGNRFPVLAFVYPLDGKKVPVRVVWSEPALFTKVG